MNHSITCSRVRDIPHGDRYLVHRIVRAHVRAFIDQFGPEHGAFSVSEVKRLLRQAWADVRNED